MPTHPNTFAVVIVWDSIHSHHKFEHSAAYGPFLASALPILAGDINIQHFEISGGSEVLKKALESPITGMSVLPVKKGKAADFLGFYNETYAKYVLGERFKGMWFHYPYEDPYIPYIFLSIDVLDLIFTSSTDGKVSRPILTL